MGLSHQPAKTIGGPGKWVFKKSGQPDFFLKRSKCKRRNIVLVNFASGDSDRALLLAYSLLFQPRAHSLIFLCSLDRTKVDPNHRVWNGRARKENRPSGVIFCAYCILYKGAFLGLLYNCLVWCIQKSILRKPKKEFFQKLYFQASNG